MKEKTKKNTYLWYILLLFIFIFYILYINNYLGYIPAFFRAWYDKNIIKCEEVFYLWNWKESISLKYCKN
jgi:hypothetical protein